MQEVKLESWEHFEAELRRLRAKHAELQSVSNTCVSDLLYRGQSSASYSLTTTLERRGCADMPLADYFRVISSIKPQLETFTDNEWKLLDLGQYEDWLEAHNHMALAPPGRIHDPSRRRRRAD